MRDYPRAQEQHLHVNREEAGGSCPECGADGLKRYPVLTEGGWWMTTKCQSCLHPISRERMGLYGSMSLMSDEL